VVTPSGKSLGPENGKLRKVGMTSLDKTFGVVRLETNKAKGGAIMNKITGLMIVLSVAIILVAPQVFAASFDWLNTTPSHNWNPLPGIGEEYSSEPMAMCEVDHGVYSVDINKKPDLPGIGYGDSSSYRENTTVASTCEGVGSSMSAKDLQVPNTPDSWEYR